MNFQLKCSKNNSIYLGQFCRIHKIEKFVEVRAPPRGVGEQGSMANLNRGTLGTMTKREHKAGDKFESNLGNKGTQANI